jgi:hypothetical protein
MPRSLSALAVIEDNAIATVAVPRLPGPTHSNERVKSINLVGLGASIMPPDKNITGSKNNKK